MTAQQRKAFEKWMDMLSVEFNEIGITSQVDLLNFIFDLKYTRSIIREQLIKPIIKQLWDFESTKELTTHHINELIDVFTLALGQKGREVKFPSIEQLMFELDKKNID